MIRFNTATCAWRRANLVRLKTPADAVAGYSEALSLLRSLTKESGGRDMAVSIVLAEMSITLRQSGREEEARRNLDQARVLAAAEKTPISGAIGSPLEAISRADAVWAAAAGRHDEAARIHSEWLRAATATAEANTDFRVAAAIAHRYRMLAKSLRAAGDQKGAAQAESAAQRLLHWKTAPR